MQNELKLMQFNLENFFVYMDNYSGEDLKTISETQWQKLTRSTTRLKPLFKLWATAEVIREAKPDIVLINEVGGPESAENFCEHFLAGEYKALIKEGNSDRGIDVGYFVRADLNHKYLLISHKNRPINFLYDHEVGGDKKSHYFARDVAELRIFKDKSSHSPSLIVLGVHLKSKLDPDGIDKLGRARRAAELKALIEIYNEVQSETKGEVPLLVGGDFNGIAGTVDTEPEFEYLYENSDLQDVMEIAGVPTSERVTQINFEPHSEGKGIQIDYFFIGRKFKETVVAEKSRVYRFKGDGKTVMPWPKTIDQRMTLPSDHYPVILTLKEAIK